MRWKNNCRKLDNVLYIYKEVSGLEFSVQTPNLSAFFEILALTYSPGPLGPYGPGPFIIGKNILS